VDNREVVHIRLFEVSRQPSNGKCGAMRIPALALLATLVFLMGPAPASAENTFVWPLEPRPTVTRPFDPPEHNWLPGHRGVDLASHPGQTVLAAGDGIVVFAGTVAGKPVVSIDHQGGLRTTYEPVTATVAAGRRITAGDPLGTVEAGHESCPVDACLHWGLRRDRDDYLNPLPLVERTVIRLEPV
jgi:murein DD-endopeptidase MepM/ murein hydrolase activator NlpD